MEVALTISTIANSQTVAGTGSQYTFGFSFVGDDASLLSVIYTDASGNATPLNSTQYSLTLNAPLPNQLWGIGGTFTYPLTGSAIAAGTYLTIVRTLPYTQDVSIRNQGNVYPQVTEKMGDTLEMQIQQIGSEIGRAIQIPITDNGINTVLPSAAQRANQFAGFDSQGNVIAALPSGGSPISTAMQPVVDAATLALALVALGIPDFFQNMIISGLTPTWPGLGTLTMTTPSGVIMVLGNRVVVSSSTYTYPASETIYDYIDINGNITHSLVETAPANAILLQQVGTASTQIGYIIQQANRFPSTSYTPTINPNGIPDAAQSGHIVPFLDGPVSWGPLNLFQIISNDPTVQSLSTKFDVNPLIQLVRAVPGVTPPEGSYLAELNWGGGDSSNPEFSVVYAGIIGVVSDPTHGAAIGSLLVHIANGAGGNTDVMQIGKGWTTGDMSGIATGGDMGYGTINVGTAYYVKGTRIPFQVQFQSTNQPITAAGNLTLPHGLGSAPTSITCYLLCVTGEHNYTAGQTVLVNPAGNDIDANASRGLSVVFDSTNIYVRFGSDASPISLLDFTTGSAVGITPTNWALRVNAFA